MNKRTIVLLGTFFLAGVAGAAGEELMTNPRAATRPWTVLRNSMTTVDQRLYAVRAEAPPVLDGKLDDPIWRKAFSVSTFGVEGFRGYTTRRNSARFLYTDTARYIGCSGQLTQWSDWLARKRGHDDGVWQDEAFEVFVDPGLTRKEYWQFIANAVGSMEDHKGWDAKPNPPWKVAVTHTDTEWTAEFEIPFASIAPASPKAGDVWGLNVFRDDKEIREFSGVSPVLDSAHDSSRFLPLEFGGVPEVYLDNFGFDRIVRGANVLKFRAFGRGVEGARIRGQVKTAGGQPVGEPTEVPLAAGGDGAAGAAVTQLPFTIAATGPSRLDCQIVKGGKVVGSYGFLVNVYEDHLLALICGGSDFIQGSRSVNLRLDLRLKEDVLPAHKLELALSKGQQVLRTTKLDKLPGVYIRGDMDIAALEVGQYVLEGRLLDADGKAVDVVRTPLNIIEGPFGHASAPAAAPAEATAGSSGTPGEVPIQFTTWGTVGQEMQYRRCTPQQVADMKKQGKTDAQIEEANQEYDCRHWTEVQDDAQKPATAFTDAEKQQGYVLFARPSTERVFYYTVPEARERLGAAGMGAFAAQGQYEPITFAVHALKDLKDVRAEVTALAGEGGAVLPAAALDVRVVRCYEQAYGSPWWNPDAHDPINHRPRKEMIPLVIEKRPSMAVPAGQSRQFWITLKVPDDCRPGVYQGQVRLTLDEAAQAVPLRLRVLPVRLVRLDKAAHMDETPVDKNAYIDLGEHGFNLISLGLQFPREDQAAMEKAFAEFRKTKDPKTRFPLPTGEAMLAHNKPALDRAIDLANQAGLKVRYVYFSFFCPAISAWTGDWFVYYPTSPELDDGYAGIVNAAVAYAKERKFPEFVVFAGDEPGGHPDTLPAVRHYVQVLKAKCPGVKTGMPVGGGMSMGIDELGQLGPHLDIFDTNYLNADLLRKIRAAGKELWICNVGSMTGDPRIDRYGFGFFPWKIGARGMAQWAYKSGNPYEQVYQGKGGAATYVFPSADNPPRPLPTIHWEAFRSGLTDQRYGATLTRLIEIASADGDATAKAAAARAVETIKDVLGQFFVGYMNRRFPDGAMREFHIHTTDGARFDTCRWRIAQEILNLQSALGPKGVLKGDELVFPMAPEESMYR